MRILEFPQRLLVKVPSVSRLRRRRRLADDVSDLADEVWMFRMTRG